MAQHHGLSRLDQLFKASLSTHGKVFSQTLGRLKPANPVQITNITHQDVINALEELTESMRETENQDDPKAADAGMTFLGQFIDHDITLDATSALGSRIDPHTIPNVRTPALDLDCVYGAGPEASNILYGPEDDGLDHFLVFGRKENPLDLARTCAGKALIGDPRNDENVIVAQVQGIFIQLHNILMSKMHEGGSEADDITHCAHDGIAPEVWDFHVVPKLKSFEEVRRFIRLHYQWIIWNEFLPAFVDDKSLEWAMNEFIFGHDAPVMPVEFSGACYRFGHATTQFKYRMTRGADPVGLFDPEGFKPRPEDGNIDLDLFFSTNDNPAEKARLVGPHLGSPLLQLPFIRDEVDLPDIGLKLTQDQARNLALRNMVRDRYTYQLASGQQFAHHLGTKKVDIPEALTKKGFTKTPLWFYALQEAEEHGHGKLTGVGGAIVASVFANLLKRDKTTFVHCKDFKPWKGFKGQPSIFSGIIDFVAKHRGHIKHPEKLQCG